MKRHPALQPLSDDHHRALVLSRRIRRAASGADEADLAALSRETRARFAAELEPHFGVEERCLLPALATRGDSRLARRIAADHARLRRLAGDAWSREVALEFSDLLAQHVRFEERVLFPRAESVLSDGELAAVAEASEINRGRLQPPADT